MSTDTDSIPVTTIAPPGARPDLLDPWLFTVPLVRAGVPEVVPYQEMIGRVRREVPRAFTRQERVRYSVRAAIRHGAQRDRARWN